MKIGPFRQGVVPERRDEQLIGGIRLSIDEMFAAKKNLNASIGVEILQRKEMRRLRTKTEAKGELSIEECAVEARAELTLLAEKRRAG